MKGLKNYLLVGLICIIAGGVTGYFLRVPKHTTEFVPGSTVYIDTCLSDNLLCTLTTSDSMAIYRIVKEGLKSKSEKVRPQIESVTTADTSEYNKPLFERVYTKELKNGHITVWDTLIVVGTIKDWNRAYKMDEVTEVRDKHTTTTAVIEQGEDDSKTVETKLIPVENNSLYLAATGSAIWNEKISGAGGIGIQNNKFSLGVSKDFSTKLKSLNGYQLNYTRSILKIKK